MRFLHVSITVKDMDDSIRFYTEVVGLKLRTRREIPENNAEIAFLTDDQSDVQLELTYWKEKKDWNQGDELDHLAFGVPDMDQAMKWFKDNNVEITKEPYSLRGSTTRIAFIADPNGIWLEIIERH
jgi:lactoylglutathione lyase